ncbi:hypothetical protein ACJMK2_041081 [Sinanodonta woodiana]|uniref:F-box domain-containing protein n=1 Tax=Sinanodonta woodiana TaxID=1069815 RepID=A0ABD3W2Y9_SINWO
MGKAKVQKNSSDNAMKENISYKSRKRKATSPLQGSQPKMTWAFNQQQQTQNLLGEMGVENLSQSSNDSCSLTDRYSFKTPSFLWNLQDDSSSFHLPPVPAAPRILLPSQVDNITQNGEDSLSLVTAYSTPHIKSSDGFLKNQVCDRVSHETQYSYDYFSLLSDEIVLTIFRWVPRFVLAKCSRVCKRWSRLVLDESLWRRLDLSNRTLMPGVLGHVLSRGVSILRLAKAEVLGPVFTGVTSIINCTRLSRIQYLDLSMAGITTNVLEEFFCICKDLRKLSLENCEVNDKICGYIGENKNLEALNLAMCQGITAAGLVPITTNCRKLESLNLGWTNLHKHSIVYLCLCLPQSLLRFNLSGCRENITDDEVKQLVKTCPNLRELDLSDSTAITSETIYLIASHLHHLEHLAVSRCYYIVPTSMPVLGQINSLLAIEMFGMLRETALQQLRETMRGVDINKFPFSCVARPTTGIRRTSIWGMRVRDNLV